MKGLQVSLNITRDPLVPDALSREQLAVLWLAAKGKCEQDFNDDEVLRAALAAWSDQACELLDLLEQNGNTVGDTRTPQQVMALGSFRSHLIMGLKALVVSERRSTTNNDCSDQLS